MKYNNYQKPPWIKGPGARTRFMTDKKKMRQQKIAQKRKEMDAESFEAPRKSVSASKRKKNTEVSKIISDIMHNWEKTGMIGKNRPPTRKAAQKMAIAVAYSIHNRKTNKKAEEGSAPVQDPMEFGEMANWRPLDGTPGLSKRKRAETFEADFDHYYSSYDKSRGMEILDRLRTMNAETKAKALDWLIDNGFLHSEEIYNSAYVNAMGDALFISDESFGAPMGFTEMGSRPFYGNPRKIAIDRWGNRRFIRRRKDGTYMKNVDVGRSIAMDRRRQSKTWAPSGYRDQGDGSPSLLERFRNRLRQ